MKKNTSKISLISLLSLSLFGCSVSPPCCITPKPQRDIALKVVDSIGKNLANTNRNYKYQLICNKSVEQIAYVANIKSRGDVVPETVSKGISNPDNKECSGATLDKFSSFLTLLEMDLVQHQQGVVLIAQFPWSNFKENEVELLAKQVDKMKGKEKIKNILLYGTHGETPKMMTIFRSLGEKAKSVGLDEKEVNLAIQNLTKGLVGQDNILALFIPAEGK
jgi:hypothetical protein